MFSSQNIKAYLKSINLDTDKNKRIAKTRFFVTLTHELALEASPHIADRLFRKNGNGYDPVQEVSQMDFVLNFPHQSLSYRRSPDYVGHHVIIPDVGISDVTAQKLSGRKEFTLLFNCQFEINDKTIITDLIDLIHENFYLTFRSVQPGLFDNEGGPVMDLLCRMCDAPEPEFATTDGQFAYCHKHKHQSQEGESIVRIRPDTAKASAITEEIREGDQPEETHKDPLVETGEFINTRNSNKGRKNRQRVN